MADMKFVNDTADSVAKAAYAKKAALGVTNPGAVAKLQMDEAEGDNPVPPPAAATAPMINGAAPAASIPGVKFTKGFSPAEKAAQKQALMNKLKELGE